MTTKPSTAIPAHGGGPLHTASAPAPNDARRIVADSWTLNDALMLSEGGFSPLTGFMDESTLASVAESCRLPEGPVWTLPILFRSDAMFEPGESIVFTDGNRDIAWMRVESAFTLQAPESVAETLFGTRDPNHPGVALFCSRPRRCYAGPVFKIATPHYGDAVQPYLMTPTESRARFAALNWRKIAGFQTRNPIHRGHEFLHKLALGSMDGVFIHPLVGYTKKDDLSAEVRFRSYDVLTRHYYHPDRHLLAALIANMNYAGPKEAVHHAIIRQNFGCTHFIVGRDHAGVGDYYGTYEAQELFESLSSNLRITMLPFDEVYYCNRCDHPSTSKLCAHDDIEPISGSRIRRLLSEGRRPDARLLRPEVADVLHDHFTQGHR